MMNRRMSHKVRPGEEVTRCFTGICFLKEATVSSEGREALSAAALKHRIPCTELLTGIAAYSNERKLASRHVKEASRHVKDACDKLYMWVSMKRKEVSSLPLFGPKNVQVSYPIICFGILFPIIKFVELA